MRRTTLRGFVAATAVLAAALVGTLHAATAEARAWLGVYTQEVTDDLRDGLDLRGDGVLVARVVPDSPASRAGLRKGDVILSFGGRGVATPARLSELVGDAHDGESVPVIVMRDGERRTLSARLSSRPTDVPTPSASDDDEDGEMLWVPAPESPDAPDAPRAPQAPRAPRSGERHRIEIVTPDADSPHAPGKPKVRTFTWNGEGEMPEDMRGMLGDLHIEGLQGLEGMRGLQGLHELHGVGPGGKKQVQVFVNGGRGRLGVRIQALDEDMASALGTTGKGVLVLDVIDGTPAEKAGLRSGDVITAVDGKPVGDGDALVDALKDQEGAVSLSITRKGVRRTVEATLEAAPRASRDREGSVQVGPGRTGERRVIRLRADERADREELREQLDDLREQVRELRQRLEESRR